MKMTTSIEQQLPGVPSSQASRPLYSVTKKLLNTWVCVWLVLFIYQSSCMGLNAGDLRITNRFLSPFRSLLETGGEFPPCHSLSGLSVSKDVVIDRFSV